MKRRTSQRSMRPGRPLQPDMPTGHHLQQQAPNSSFLQSTSQQTGGQADRGRQDVKFFPTHFTSTALTCFKSLIYPLSLLSYPFPPQNVAMCAEFEISLIVAQTNYSALAQSGAASTNTNTTTTTTTTTDRKRG